MRIRLPLLIVLIAFITGYSGGIAATPAELLEEWDNPRRTYKSHTRWWCPGNVMTNTLVNYVASLDDIPEVPEKLNARLGGTNPKLKDERAYRNPPREFKTSDLPPSGLMGPFVIKTSIQPSN